MSRRNENIFEEKSHLGRKIGVTLLVVLLLTFGAGAVANFAISISASAAVSASARSRLREMFFLFRTSSFLIFQTVLWLCG